MYISKKDWQAIQKRIDVMDRRQMEFMRYANETMSNLIKQGKKSYVWELREEEIELMKDGHKYRGIRKIIE